MNCLVLPVSLIRRRSLRYRPLSKDDKCWRLENDEAHERPVTVVVGKEKRVFLVDPFVLQQNPFQLLMDTSMRKKDHQGVVFVDVDAILFEHMLWLMHNDSSSLLNLNLEEIIDFYSQDV